MEILQWFKKNYQDIVTEMKNISHDISPDKQSVYHCEGDIYTHTLMVYGLVHEENDIELSLAVLLHDIGKIYTQIDKGRNNQYSFTYHENVSVFKSIDILNKFEKDFDIEIDKEKILFAIGHHQLLHKIGTVTDSGEVIITEEERILINKVFGSNKDLFHFMIKLGRADSLGRISTDKKNSRLKYNFLENHFFLYKYYEDFENKPKAYILSGLPCAGKSTLSEKLIKEMNGDCIYLSTDHIMKELFSKEFSNYNMYYSKDNVKKSNEVLFKRLKVAIMERKNIIIDNTNLEPLIRNRKANIIPDKYYEKHSISVLIGETLLEERNNARKEEGKYISKEILFRMAKNFELPTCENFAKVKLILS